MHLGIGYIECKICKAAVEPTSLFDHIFEFHPEDGRELMVLMKNANVTEKDADRVMLQHVARLIMEATKE